ncbi:MAG: response regulator transcription factor [Bacteroidales bacterium]|nr:response regulator transcription factor [Bacteroidales bacterium]
MKIRCAVVDDEALARKYLKDYISKVPFLEFVGDFNSPLKAYELLEKGKVDLMFLDIQMPEITGLDFLRSLDRKPFVILTTAYKEYALEGYELDISDYLLKPFSFNRFLKAVNKVNNAMLAKGKKDVPSSDYNQTDFHEDYIIIRADRKYYKINYDDLIFIEGQKAYVTFHSEGKKNVTALASLKELEEKLPENKFIRIHKSYIVSVKKIDALEGNVIEISGEKLPVGKSFKPRVSELFGLDE